MQVGRVMIEKRQQKVPGGSTESVIQPRNAFGVEKCIQPDRPPSTPSQRPFAAIALWPYVVAYATG